MTAFLILLLSLLIGLTLRIRSARVPLDWDCGMLLYQSYWHRKTARFITAHTETNDLSEDCMIRFQSLGFSYISIWIERMCKDSVVKYHIFDLCYHLIVSAIIYLWASALFNPGGAALAAGFYYLFSSMPFFWPSMHSPEKYQILFTALGLLFTTLTYQLNQPFYAILAGAAFFVSMIFKQNAAFVISANILFLFFTKNYCPTLLLIATMTGLYTIVFTYYLYKKVSFYTIWSKFFFTIRGFLPYILQLQRDEDDKLVKPEQKSYWQRLSLNLIPLLKESSSIWFASIAWFILNATFNPDPIFFYLSALMLATILCFVASNRLSPYYYIPFLPMLAVTAGNIYPQLIATHSISSPLTISIILISAALLFLNLKKIYAFTFKLCPFDQGDYIYQYTYYNFGRSEEIGHYIRENSEPDDYIYVYNVNPEIYFYAQRKACTNTIYINKFTFHALSKDELEINNRIIAEKIRKARPKFIVINRDDPLSIGAFEKITGEKYIFIKEYLAARRFSFFLDLFKLRQQDEARIEVEKGEEQFNASDYNEALRHFNKALEYDPLNDSAHNNIGACYYQTGELKSALDSFMNAFEINVYNKDALLNLLSMEIPVHEKIGLIHRFLTYTQDDEIESLLNDLNRTN